MMEEHEVEEMLIDDELGRDEEGWLPEASQDGWHIKDDNAADWAIEKIASIDAEYRRMEIIARNKIKQVQDWLAQQKEQAEKERGFFELKLREYFEKIQDKAKETKTQKVYKLPAGTLRLKKQQPEIVRDDSKLLQWVKANKPRFVKIKESVDWAGMKELVAFEGDKAIDLQTGEVIDGVEVKEREPKFEVEVR